MTGTTAAETASTPLISVALCTYNGERFLRCQLESLLAQDYPALEFVAVDDASTDGTLTILEEFRRRDSRLQVHRNAVNLGFNANFERAIGLCRGALIAPCDQDDIWERDKLSRLAAARGDAALVYCDSRLVDENGRDLGLRASDRVNMIDGSDARALLFHNCVSGHALIVTRELAAAAMPFPDGFFHDWWLALIAAARSRIVYVDACLVRFRQHAASTTDLSGRKRVRPARTGGAGRRMEWLERLCQLANAHQRPFLAEFCRRWNDALQSYFAPGLALLIHRHRHTLFRVSRDTSWRKALRAWRFLPGVKLKQLQRRRGLATG